ncbi:hypothetical protein IAR50_006780 [Cryptococcus sp. DSM 104548]
MSVTSKKGTKPPQTPRSEDKDATNYTTYSARKVAIQGPPALQTAKRVGAEESNIIKRGRGHPMGWRGGFGGSGGAAVTGANTQERQVRQPPWLQRKSSSSATPPDLARPRVQPSQNVSGNQDGHFHWKNKVPMGPAAMASTHALAAQPIHVQWAARAPPTRPSSSTDSSLPLRPSTSCHMLLPKAPSPTSIGIPSFSGSRPTSSERLTPYDYIPSIPSPNSLQKTYYFPSASIPPPSPDSFASIPMPSAPTSTSPPSRPHALQQWFEAKRRFSSDASRPDAVPQQPPRASEAEELEKISPKDSTVALPSGRPRSKASALTQSGSVAQDVEMGDEERDVKPSFEELERALEEGRPKIRDEDRLEGCSALTRAQLPNDVWSPNPASRREARGRIREQQEKELTKMGRKLVRSRWMSDGVAYDWKLVKQVTPVEHPLYHVVEDDVTVPASSSVEQASDAMEVDVDNVSLERRPGQHDFEAQLDTSGKHQSRRNVMALAVSAAATQPAPVSGLSMSRENSRENREPKNGATKATSPAAPAQAHVMAPSHSATGVFNRAPPSPIPAKPVAEATTSIPSKPASLSAPSRAVDATPNPPAKANAKPEARWGPAVVGQPPKSGAISRIYKYEIAVPPHIQITAGGKFTPQFQAWKLKHRDDMSGQSSRGCPSREVYLNHEGPSKCKSLQVRVVPIDMQDPSTWPLTMYPDIVEYVIPDHFKPRQGEVNPRSSVFRAWEQTCLDMASEPDQCGRPTRWVKSMFCPSMSKGSLRVRWRGKTAAEIASYKGAPIVLPGSPKKGLPGSSKKKGIEKGAKEDGKDKGGKDQRKEEKEKERTAHGDSQPEKRLRSDMMDDEASSRKKSRRESELNGEREWDRGKKEGAYPDEGSRSRRREKERERSSRPLDVGKGKAKGGSRERDSGWGGMNVGKGKEKEQIGGKEKERDGQGSPSKASRPTVASFLTDEHYPKADIPATSLSGDSTSPSAYAPALPPVMAMVKSRSEQSATMPSANSERSNSGIADVPMANLSIPAGAQVAQQAPTNAHPLNPVTRNQPIRVSEPSARSASPAVSSPLLEELASGVRRKMNEIQTWTQMLSDFPDMADSMRGQIDRTQTEIFALYAKMGVEKRRLLNGE